MNKNLCETRCKRYKAKSHFNKHRISRKRTKIFVTVVNGEITIKLSCRFFFSISQRDLFREMTRTIFCDRIINEADCDLTSVHRIPTAVN